MKKILLAAAVGFGLVACGDNATNSENNGGALDSNVTMPPVQPDNSSVSPMDSTGVSSGTDSAVQKSDTGSLRSLNGGNSANGAGGGNGGSTDKSGNSAGKAEGQASGKSTNSNNSGSAAEDTNGSK